jgi:hypothetical protein
MFFFEASSEEKADLKEIGRSAARRSKGVHVWISCGKQVVDVH